MNNRKLLLAAVTLLCAGTLLQAQVYQQGFFLKDYRPIYRINPALFPDTDFIGGFEVTRDRAQNYGASSYLFPRDGEVVTGLHESVSADEFLGRLPDVIGQNVLIGVNLFSYGIKRGDAYHTFEVSAHIPSSYSVPKSVFDLLKRGTVLDEYDLSRFGVRGQAYIELAYGYGRRLSDVVSIGGRIKLLAAMWGASYRFTRFKVEKNASGSYTIFSSAELDLPSRFYKIETLPDQEVNLMDIKSNYLFPLPTGGGAAVDLGVAVTPNKYLTLSASILDLGGIVWHYGNASISHDYMTFDGLGSFSYSELNKNALTEKAEEIGKKFLNGLKPRLNSDQVRWEVLPFTANLGVRYTLPCCEQVRLGAIANYTNNQYTPYWEARLGVDYDPFPWLDLTGSFGRSQYGFVYGFGLAAKFSRFQLYFGYENSTCGSLKRSSTPIDPAHKAWSVGLTYDL
jgi:hypothetical protein